MVLLWVTSAASETGAVDGTIIYDLLDNKVKYRKAGSWFDLTIDTNLQSRLTERTTAKVAIRTNAGTDTTPGILVLTDENKAIVFSKITSLHLNIVNPSAGMIVYNTVQHQHATYNGKVWHFWKA